jgi:hypothetical protein
MQSFGHLTRDCRCGWQANKNEQGVGNPRRALSEYIAPLCATQVDGQAFFCIPNCPSELNARERVNTTVVTITRGMCQQNN